MQEVEFTHNFFLMELGGVEVVLGMDWLASLGNIEANFRNLSLKWTQGDQQFAIHGEPALCNVQASWKSMVKVLQEEGEGYLVDCVTEQKEAEFDASLWEDTLSEFESVFNMHVGLPPARAQDHAIVMQPGATIPNIRPYSYIIESCNTPFLPINFIRNYQSSQKYLINTNITRDATHVKNITN